MQVHENSILNLIVGSSLDQEGKEKVRVLVKKFFNSDAVLKSYVKDVINTDGGVRQYAEYLQKHGYVEIIEPEDIDLRLGGHDIGDETPGYFLVLKQRAEELAKQPPLVEFKFTKFVNSLPGQEPHTLRDNFVVGTIRQLKDESESGVLPIKIRVAGFLQHPEVTESRVPTVIDLSMNPAHRIATVEKYDSMYKLTDSDVYVKYADNVENDAWEKPYRIVINGESFSVEP